MTTEGVTGAICFGIFVVGVFMIGFTVGQDTMSIGEDDDDDPLVG